jgi:hypothetical protein
MLTGRLSATDTDLTQRQEGKLGGAAWTLIAGDVAVESIPLGTAVPCPVSVDETVRISYEVRGRRATSAPILVVGEANVTVVSGSDPVVTADVRTFDNARVAWYIDTAAQTVQIAITQHATEDWYFQVNLAYDVRVPA